MNLNRREALGLGASSTTALLNPSGAIASTLGDTLPTPSPSLINALPARRRQPLDGTWKYILDPFDIARSKPRLRRTVWLNTIESLETGLIEYEWATSPEMKLPGDWNTAEPELHYYEGPVFFRRTFRTTVTAGERQFLAFEAINYRAQIWLDGVEIGRHEGGFTPFFIEVTGKLTSGAEHAIVVCADSRHDDETLPARDFDWKNFGGITRSSWMVTLPETFIRDSHVRLEGGAIVIDVTLDGKAAAGTSVRVSIGRDFVLTGTTDAAGRMRVMSNRPSRLGLWSPDAPILHDVTISAADDTTTERIGLREVIVRGRDILLNGKALYIKGICLHEEAIGPETTRAVTGAEARALLTEAKALGCNFVRLAHYPHAEHVARIADELGLMVWAEIPVYWEDVSYDSPRTLALARHMMAELVLRDRNRASIVMWSVANETPVTAERTQFLRTVIRDIRALDSNRLISAALNKNVDIGGVKDGETRILVNDPLGEDLDVIAVNQYEAWYSKRLPVQISEVSFTTIYDKPLIFSEFGADAQYGHRGSAEERWTEEFQASLYEETLKLVARTPGCVGCTPWLLKDFRSPRRWHGRHQKMWNRKGVISPEGHRKLAWSVLAHYYANR